MKAASIGVPPLALLFAVSWPGVARAADCPVAHPVTSAFRLVQSLPGTVVAYPPNPSGAMPAHAAQVHRGMTLSGTVTGLNPSSPAAEFGLTVQMDLVRYLRTGQGYGAGEVIITTRPPVPFMSPETLFQGRINAVVTNAEMLTGYLAATGAGAYTGTSLRGRFSARLMATGVANPGTPPNPFGGRGPTNPLSFGSGGGGMANPFMAPGGGGLANPFTTPGGGGLANPFTTPGGGGLVNPFTTPGDATPAMTVEVLGTLGSPEAPALMLERDPVAMVAMAGAPDLAMLASGVLPLVQPSTGSMSVVCKGGKLSMCPEEQNPRFPEGTELRQDIPGTGSVNLRSGSAAARYRVELSLDSVRPVGPFLDAHGYGHAQGRVRLFAGRSSVPVYEGTLDGILAPALSRGRPIRNRYLWNGFMALNGSAAGGAVADSLRCAFSAAGTFATGRIPSVQFSITLGQAKAPFVRVLAGR